MLGKRQQKTDTISLVDTKDAPTIVASILGLGGIVSLTVSEGKVTVTREVPAEDPVFPSESYLETAGRLEKLTIEEVPTAGRHPLEVWRSVMQVFDSRQIRPLYIVEPESGLASAFMGLEKDSPVMGLPVVEHPQANQFPDRLIVVGGPTLHRIDATMGVTVVFE